MITSDKSRILLEIFNLSLRHFGTLHWWPGESDFEISIGAILTQNTNWKNASTAIENMKNHGILSIDEILESNESQLAQIIRSSGYYNMKARKLKNFANFLRTEGGFETLKQLETNALRQKLLTVKGIGAETCDDMLLYVFLRPVFVVDVYTKRIFARHKLISDNSKYEDIQNFFHANLHERVGFFGEYHAQIVYIGKNYCSAKTPKCHLCPLRRLLPKHIS